MSHVPIQGKEIIELSKRQAWIVDPINRAAQSIQNTYFFKWVSTIKEPRDFGEAAKQLYFHSVNFPKCMGLMCALTPISDSSMLPFYSEHAYTEAEHHLMLMDWMLKHKILQNPKDILHVIANPETNACVNMGYQLAIEQDKEKWLVSINSGIELCSNLFFKVVAKKMTEISAGHDYFDIHVEADEFHSVMGLKHIKTYDPNSFRGKQLIACALEGISLWTSMLHSWINIKYMPVFDLNGVLKTNEELSAVA